MEYLIIGIDPGKGGGIAYHSQTVNAVKMPDTRKWIYDFLISLKEKAEINFEKPLVFIEKVQMFHSDTDQGGKSFGISKLLANLECLQTCCEILEIPFVLVPSQTWQKELGFKKIKGESKPYRKKRYAELARQYFPHLKITLHTADAACLLIFGKKKLKLDPNWINERLNQNEADLF